mgnify:CR=1 FL=1
MTPEPNATLAIADLIEPDEGWPVIEADDQLVRSIDAVGVIVPIVVSREGAKWRVTEGKRRVAAMIRLCRDEVPAWARESNGDPMLEGVVANVVRRPGRRSEIIRLMRDLRLRGPAHVGTALGLEQRRARILMRMTGLADAVLDALAAHELEAEAEPMATDPLPGDEQLCTIATAPIEHQLAALERHRTDDGVYWDAVEAGCTATRVSRTAAWFDADTPDLHWDEDLFAQPDDEDRFTTADLPRFIELQRAALTADFAARRPRAGWHVVGWRRESQMPAIPEDMSVISLVRDIKGASASKAEPIYAAVAESGRWPGHVLAYRVRAKGAAKADPLPDTSQGDAAADDEDNTPAPAPAPVADIMPITTSGRIFIRDRKHLALQACLRAMAEPINWRLMTALLCLAFRADNVLVRSGGMRPSRHPEAELVDPAGQMTLPDDETLLRLVVEQLAETLNVGEAEGSYPFLSGSVAEWIGAHLGADNHLPRFDDAVFLKEVRGDELRNAAAMGEFGKLPKSVTDMRQRLAGNLPTWRPPGSTFGAPGPKPPTTRSAPQQDQEQDDAA